MPVLTQKKLTDARTDSTHILAERVRAAFKKMTVMVAFFLFALGSTMLLYRAMAIRGEINAAETSSYYAEAGQ